MGKEGRKIGLFYYCIYARIVEKYRINNLIRKRELWGALGELFHIPKNIRNKVITELIDYGFITDTSADTIYINGKYHNKIKKMGLIEEKLVVTN